MDIYEHVPHPHTLERLEHRDKPKLTTDMLDTSTTIKRFNSWLCDEDLPRASGRWPVPISLRSSPW